MVDALALVVGVFLAASWALLTILFGQLALDAFEDRRRIRATAFGLLCMIGTAGFALAFGLNIDVRPGVGS